MKNLGEWTRKDFDALPSRQWGEDIGEFTSLVILPTKHIHDSGYRAMDFVAVSQDQKPICRLSGCSDVIHIDGIGGLGNWSAEGGIPRTIRPKGWTIDCLRKSGLLRIFADKKLTAGPALSSFEIYAS